MRRQARMGQAVNGHTNPKLNGFVSVNGRKTPCPAAAEHLVHSVAYTYVNKPESEQEG